MATHSVNGSASAGRQHKGRILFEERLDFWWLTGADLRRARSLLGLRCFGENVGFQPADGWGYAKLLVAKGFQVDLRRGDKTYTLTNRLRESDRALVTSRVLWLDPSLLFPPDSLARLRQQATCEHSPTHDLVGRLRQALSHGDTKALCTFGKLFVYQAAPDLYEVDWQLTTVQPDIFEALAAVAADGNHKLPCHLVLPKGQRVGARAKQRPVLPTDTKPAGKGQLRLLF